MADTFRHRLKTAWNAFLNRDSHSFYSERGYASRPDRPRFTRGNERSIITALYNRMALDTASITIQHCSLDENGRFEKVVDSGLNDCFNLQANIDQTGSAFVQDIVMSMFNEGSVAIVPVDTDDDPNETGSYRIDSMRTGQILEWFPSKVRLRVYNDRTGEREDVVLSKDFVGIIENPFYAVINEPNSTMQRLIHKLSLLDVTDDEAASGKLDLIIQLPYVVKGQKRRAEAEQRRKDVEMQLTGSKYGIAYTDGTERVIQLNRSLENNLMKQIEYLTSMLYSQLGITQDIMDGTASESTMTNYFNRTIDSIISSIVNELKRKFLTTNARSRGQSVMYFRDPFKLVPLDKFAEMADKLSRNEIMTANEIRQSIGLKPSKDPKADQLINSNLNQANNVVTEKIEVDQAS